MKLKALLSVALLTAAASAAGECTPKYVFYFIGDGMGIAPVNSTEVYRRAHGATTPLAMNTLPHVGWLTTHSASSPVTDSSAAGTALSTGSKTRNYMLGMNADTVAVTSVARQLFDEGYGVGLVTSVAPDDATPGAFYAHVPNRSMYYTIGCQMAECGYQFIAGAGLRGLVQDGNPTDLPERFAANNVQIVRGPEGIADISAERVLLLNNEGTHEWNIGYTIDSIPSVLNLPLMTRTCLAHLQRTSPDKFFMMVEGGNIDHALHANDGGAAVKEIINFNEAIEVALDFYRSHPEETLIIVTADHDTGGSALLKNAGTGILNIDFQKVSKEEFSDFCKNLLRSRMNFTWEDMQQYLRDNLGLFGPVEVSDEDAARLREMFDRTFELRNSADQETLYASFNAFAVDVFRIFNDAAGFAFTTTSHSGNPVPVYAIGCGAERFSGYTDNTDVPRRIRCATGLCHRH